MRIKIFDNEKADLYQWHTWFAWRPVFVGDDLVWMEKVLRIKTYSSLASFRWKYQLIQETEGLNNEND